MRAKPWEVPDGLRQRIEPLLPNKHRRFRYPGRMRCCSPSCTPLISSNGSGRSPTPATYRRKGGRENWSQPGRSGAQGQQAPSARRRRRRATRLDAHRRQSQRRDPAAGSTRPGAFRAWSGRSSATPSANADRRPRLRPRQVASARLAPRRQADHRSPPDRARIRPESSAGSSSAPSLGCITGADS